MGDVSALNERFGIAGVAEVIADRAGMPAVWIEGRNGTAAGTVYFHGAHVAAWRPAGAEEVLWLSHKSQWQADKAIRGGVPICFPWFGPKKDDPKAPAHGFARTGPWQLESLARTADGVAVAFVMRDDDQTRALWPHEFELRHRITVGRQLAMDLELTNTGRAAITAEEAQHTYFSVGDVRQIRILGLDGTHYIDKVDGLKEKRQEGDIRFTGETDRVYLETESPVVLEDPLKKRRITVVKRNSRTTVVWNPWIDKAKAMADFGDDEWPGMVCIETCNVGQSAVELSPGQTHRMSSQVQVEGM